MADAKAIFEEHLNGPTVSVEIPVRTRDELVNTILRGKPAAVTIPQAVLLKSLGPLDIESFGFGDAEIDLERLPAVFTIGPEPDKCPSCGRRL